MALSNPRLNPSFQAILKFFWPRNLEEGLQQKHRMKALLNKQRRCLVNEYPSPLKDRVVATTRAAPTSRGLTRCPQIWFTATFPVRNLPEKKMRRLKPGSNLIIPPGLTAASDKDRTWPTGVDSARLLKASWLLSLEYRMQVRVCSLFKFKPAHSMEHTWEPMKHFYSNRFLVRHFKILHAWVFWSWGFSRKNLRHSGRFFSEFLWIIVTQLFAE